MATDQAPDAQSVGSAGSYHVPVMFQECLDALAIRPDGVYVDGTFGGGGHSRGILSQLGESGRLIAFDQDADAMRNIPEDPRLLFIPENFRHIARFLRLHGIDQVDGILADLGVSSYQFDTAERGFSIRFDGPLDMRMDQRASETAASLLARIETTELHRVFERYGEVTNARTLAAHLVGFRQTQPMTTLQQLVQACAPLVKGPPQKYLAQVFQAIRMAVNDELGALEAMLQQIPTCLKPGGRAAIITFHSLEDRLVKQYLKTGRKEEDDPYNLYGKTTTPLLKPVHKKPILPSAEEYQRNKRSRSAKLRVAEKI
jgi:16S rRNA (cytosine1402-N4)-methyltransferase